MLRYTKNSRQRAIAVHSAIALLLLFTMFISHFNFVETYILPKWYGFIFGTIILVLDWNKKYSQLFPMRIVA